MPQSKNYVSAALKQAMSGQPVVIALDHVYQSLLVHSYKSYFTSVDVKSSWLEPYAVSKKKSSLQARDVLANNIRSLRAKRGISQEELADIAALHRTYVGSIERSERNVSIDNIAKLADALGVKINELLKDSTAF